MTAPAPVVVQPDAEAWVWANLRAIPGVTSFSVAAQQLDSRGWLMAHTVQVDVIASRKAAARQAAERVRQVMTSLADVPWPDGTVAYVQPLEGPFWLAESDGRPRYVARYEVRVHPRRDAAGIHPGHRPASQMEES